MSDGGHKNKKIWFWKDWPRWVKVIAVIWMLLLLPLLWEFLKIGDYVE